jgi:long-chain acyl-CoA synthetase
MTVEAPAEVAAVYRDDPRLDGLIGPGGPFEVEPVVVEGVPLRDFVRSPRSVLDIFDAGQTHADLVHVVYRDERLTFGQARERALSVAHALQTTFGVRAGDRVAICMRNLPEYVLAVWGAALCGAIVTPMNSWWLGAELGYALGDAGAKVAFLDAERADRLREHGRPGGLTVVGVRGAPGDPGVDLSIDVDVDDLLQESPIDPDAVVRPGRDDVVAMLYTSGTTGTPKGALITNRGMTGNLWNMAFSTLREGLISGRPPAPDAQPATLSAQPLFHIGGMSSIFGAPLGGLKMVMMHKWDVEEALRLAQEEKVTQFGGVPTVVRQVLDRPGVAELDLPIRGFPMGGAAVPPDLPVRAIEHFGRGIQLLNGYGLTETTSAVVTNVGEEFATRPTSVGRPNLTADVKVVGPDGDELGAGQVGEICCRSPQVVKGYWHDEAATEASFVDGWFHSGDLGYLDDEGFLYVVDRLKDVVIRGGENVYCAEVEAVLHEHPAIASAAIVGVPEPAMGERVCAVVVPRRGAAVDLETVREFTLERLAAFKAPEALLVADALPETATGKIDKKSLRGSVEEAAGGLTRLW